MTLRNVFIASLIVWVATLVIGGPVVVNELALLVALVCGVILAYRWLRCRLASRRGDGHRGADTDTDKGADDRAAVSPTDFP